MQTGHISKIKIKLLMAICKNGKKIHKIPLKDTKTAYTYNYNLFYNLKSLFWIHFGGKQSIHYKYKQT